MFSLSIAHKLISMEIYFLPFTNLLSNDDSSISHASNDQKKLCIEIMYEKCRFAITIDILYNGFVLTFLSPREKMHKTSGKAQS